MGSLTISRLSAALALVVLGGCCTAPPYVTARLDVPAPPVLPLIQAEEFVLVEDGPVAGVAPPAVVMELDVYRRLVRRDSLRKGEAETLRAIIEQHNSRVE